MAIKENPVGFWLGRVDPQSGSVYGSTLKGFLCWLNEQEEWRGADARTLLVR